MFAAVAERAQRLLGADSGVVVLREGDDIRLVADVGRSLNAAVNRPAPSTVRLSEDSPVRQLLRHVRTIHLHGTPADIERDFPGQAASWRVVGYERHATLWVPLRHEGVALGAIGAGKADGVPFSERQIALLETFAAQVVIAMRNTRLFSELQESNAGLSEALEQQTVSAEILRVISGAPGDLETALQAINDAALRLCAAQGARVFLRDGDELVAGANVAHAPGFGAGFMVAGTRFPVGTIKPVFDAGHSLHLPDYIASFESAGRDVSYLRATNQRTALHVPLLRGSDWIGMLTLLRFHEIQPFSDREIALAELFAGQAVIAIENARLFEEVQTRTREVEERNAALTEALAYQQGTSEVLTLISRSPTDVQVVLDAIVERAAGLLESPNGLVCFIHGADAHAVSTMWAGVLGPDTTLATPGIARDYVTPESIAGAVVQERRTVAVAGGPERMQAQFPLLARDHERWRARGIALPGSGVAVPLQRAGEVFGLISISRPSPESYTPAQIALLETFAEQAVIAIENANLFNDLREALEQQTATAEILGIISSSPTDLQPVFTAVAERAQRLLGSDTALVVLRDGDGIRFVAQVGPTIHVALNRPLGRSGLPEGGVLAQAMRLGRTMQAHGTADEIARDYPTLADALRAAGLERRAALAVPLVHEGVALGALLAERADGVPFMDRQIALLETFAAQVVIAMQNTRFFNELQQSNASLSEALEQQTATAGVLQAISRSAFDLPAVLHLLTEHAVRLCHADTGSLNRVLDGALRAQAAVGVLADNVHLLPPVTSEEGGNRSLVGRALASGRTEHIPDMSQDPLLADSLEAWVRLGLGHRTRLVVPLLHGQEVIGALGLWRMAVSPFSAREIALVETFADQAVIAIENARLIDEIREKSRQLEEASQHKSAFLSAMSHELRTPLNAVIGYSEILAEDAQDAGHTDMIPDLDKINAAGKHLLSLISNVLDLSKEPTVINVITESEVQWCSSIHHGSCRGGGGGSSSPHP
ncbi:MAG: GAF domain-containing protein, partial [Dehalococcoidia bacterium]